MEAVDSTLTETDFVARVASGAWPSVMAHGVRDRFYDYDIVSVRWSDGQVHDYKMGEARTGYGNDSAFAHANLILSMHARKEINRSVELDRVSNSRQT